MDTLNAINQRRSIRKFKNKPVPRELIVKILTAAGKTPSSKNTQPWFFAVLDGKKKEEVTDCMLNKLKILNKLGLNTGSGKNSAEIMKQAPAVILVFNSGRKFKRLFNIIPDYSSLSGIQSIGAAVQTMLLAAEDLGLGTLWICDIYYTDREICRFLKTKLELIAAVALGYADETPDARPRKELNEIAMWFSK